VIWARFGDGRFRPAPCRVIVAPVKLRSITVLVALLASAACGSTTAGTGTVNRPSSPVASTADFPSESLTPGGPALPAPTSAPVTQPAPSSAAPSGTVHPVPSAPLRTATVHASDGATYVVKIWADVKDDTCFDHAHGGPIVTFLTKHPCGGLERFLATTTVQGRPVGFALSATGFPGTAKDPYKYAGQFSELEQKDGTGSIDDLMMDGYRLPQGPPHIPAGEAFNVLGQDSGVTVWDAWYLDGSTPNDDKALITMTEDLFLQF